MKRMILRSVRVPLLLIIALFISNGNTVATAQNLDTLLTGDYEFAGSRICAVSPGGFADDLSRLGSGFPALFFWQGTLSYAGDGTGEFIGQRLAILPPNSGPGQFPVNFADPQTCDITYSVNPDRSFSQEMNCTLDVVAGSPTGPLTITLTGVQLRGQISSQRDHLLFSNTTPNIELALPPFGERHQICGWVGTAIKKAGAGGDLGDLEDEDDEDDDD